MKQLGSSESKNQCTKLPSHIDLEMVVSHEVRQRMGESSSHFVDQELVEYFEL